jgi:hypothetical protein
MLQMLPLLVADPTLPEDVRRALLDSPEEGAVALVNLGLSCTDAVELTGLEVSVRKSFCCAYA